MPASFPRGRFVWHELLTTDPDAASAFYAKVIGWKTQAMDQDPTYRMWMMGARSTGGLMRLPDQARRMGAPPHWMPYVAVPNVDESVRQAEGLGARVYVAPRDVPPGRFATLADPWGAAFSVFTPSSAEAMGSDTAEVGDFSWHEHVSADWKKAWDFYSKLFGWQHESSLEMGPGNTYFMYKRAGTTQAIGGFYNLMPGQGAPPHWLGYTAVKSVDTAATAATRAGGKILHGPMDVPGGGRIVILADPQGATFALHAAAAARPAKSRRRALPAKRKPARRAKAVARKAKAKPKRTARRRTRRRPTR